MKDDPTQNDTDRSTADGVQSTDGRAPEASVGDGDVIPEHDESDGEWWTRFLDGVELSDNMATMAQICHVARGPVPFAIVDGHVRILDTAPIEAYGAERERQGKAFQLASTVAFCERVIEAFFDVNPELRQAATVETSEVFRAIRFGSGRFGDDQLPTVETSFTNARLRIDLDDERVRVVDCHLLENEQQVRLVELAVTAFLRRERKLADGMRRVIDSGDENDADLPHADVNDDARIDADGPDVVSAPPKRSYLVFERRAPDGDETEVELRVVFNTQDAVRERVEAAPHGAIFVQLMQSDTATTVRHVAEMVVSHMRDADDLSSGQWEVLAAPHDGPMAYEDAMGLVEALQSQGGVQGGFGG